MVLILIQLKTSLIFSLPSSISAVEENKGISGLRKEALIPLHYIAITGAIERGEFKKMTGMSERSAERLLKALLDYKLLRSVNRH